MKRQQNKKVEMNKISEMKAVKGVDDKGSPRGQHRKRRAVLVVLFVLVILAATGYGYIYHKLNKLDQTQLPPEEIESNTLVEKEEKIMETYTNIAIFGIDNRSNGNYGEGNSDTIMLASINNRTNEVRIVSIYRDTYLRVNSKGYYGKANAAYSFNGAAGGLSLLNTNLDLEVNKYVSVDWYAVVDAVNLLDGVEIEINEEERRKINEYAPEVSRITGIETNRVTESGKVKLDGVQAMAYARIRKLAGNDYKRTQRQRILIEAMFQKVKGSDFSTINSMLNEIFPRVETNLLMKDILSLAMNLSKFEIKKTTGFPFDKVTVTLSSVGDCVVPATLVENVKMLHQYLFVEESYTVSPELIEISQEITRRTGIDTESPYIDRDSYTTSSENIMTEES